MRSASVSARENKLIIFHHHLLPGGVTDVIRHALTSLCELNGLSGIIIVCGRRQNSEAIQKHIDSLSPRIPLAIEFLPELDYLSQEGSSGDPDLLEKLLTTAYGSEQNIWLIHNFHLGKNWALTAALNSIARSGKQRMIYQIHDFPECARYANLKELKDHIPGSLYPVSPSLRYCVINVRDFEILKKAGLPEEHLFLLENPVPAAGAVSDSTGKADEKKKILQALGRQKPSEGIFHTEGEIWLYPVRSIRRKNVLEGGFIAALQESEVNLVLTLPGVSPQEKGYSDLVEKAYARGLIPGFWGSGTLPEDSGVSYRGVIKASDLIFSSSVQEGFGYMYLNALLWGKGLIARSLDIMGGFLPLMKDYPAYLYNRVSVPADPTLNMRTGKLYRSRLANLKEYLTPDIQEQLHSELEEYLAAPNPEFSYLAPEDQYEVLEKLKDRTFADECRQINRELLNRIESVKSGTPSDKSAELYRAYGVDSYRKNFMKIINSFYETENSEIHNNLTDQGIDGQLRSGFSRLEFLRLLYS